MRFVGVCFIAICLTGCRFTVNVGGFDFQGETNETSRSGRIEHDTTKVQIENEFGKVRVEPGLEGDFRWQWKLKAWASTEREAEDWLDRLELEESQDSGTARFTFQLPEDRNGLRGVQSDLVLQVPAGVEVELRHRGDADVRGVEGHVKIRNRHGDVTLSELAGEVDVDTEHGDLTATGLGKTTSNSEHGTVKLTEVNGNLILRGRHAHVEVRGVTGDATTDTEHKNITLESIAGALQLEHEHGQVKALGVDGRVKIDLEHGALTLDAKATDVEIDVEHAKSKLTLRNPELKRLRVKSQHGNVEATLPSTVEAVSIKSEHGNVRSQLPLDIKTPFRFDVEHGGVSVGALDAR